MHPIPKEPLILRDTAGQDRLLERPNRWVRYRTPAIVLIAVALALGTLLLSALRLSPAGTSVSRERLSIATVERGTFVRDVVADGQVVAAVSPTLYASVPGLVTLEVHAGDTVTKGQELATIESPDLTAKLEQEEATLQAFTIDWRRARMEGEHKLRELRGHLEQAQVDQKTTQRELDRSRKAYEVGAYPQLQVLRAEDFLEKAQFALAQAEMSYASQPETNQFEVGSRKALLDRQQVVVTDLRRQVDALHVRSPVDGQVGQVQVRDRASIEKYTPLLSVVDLSALEVEIRIPESLARDLRPGMKGDLEGDGRHWQGTVGGVSPEVIDGQVTARLHFGDDKPSGLRQSQRLTVRVLIDRRDNVLMVDRGSFVDQEGGGFCYLVRDNVAVRRPIRLGAVSISKVEILDGVAEGDRIVISGTDKFNSAGQIILAK